MSAAAQPAALEEVRGPSAFGGGAGRFFRLTWLLSVTEFKLNYFGTVFGYLWTLLRPLLLFAVLYTVFTRIIRFQVPHYAQILLLNLTLYWLFSEATSRSVRSVASNENIVRKTHFPRIVIPVSTVTTSLLNVGLNLVAVLIFLTATGVGPRLSWFALPVVVGALAIFTTGVALLLSALFVRFRDVAQLWSLLVTVLFYASPVLYPVEVIPERFPGWLHFILYVNPLVPILDEARRVVVDPSAPSPVELAGNPFGIIAPVCVVLAVCALGLWTFVRAAPRVAEEL
jgi:ABC-2 type transport system permease protein